MIISNSPVMDVFTEWKTVSSSRFFVELDPVHLARGTCDEL